MSDTKIGFYYVGLVQLFLTINKQQIVAISCYFCKIMTKDSILPRICYRNDGESIDLLCHLFVYLIQSFYTLFQQVMLQHKCATCFPIKRLTTNIYFAYNMKLF